MNKENRDVLIRLEVRDENDGKTYYLKKQETFEIEYGKKTKKIITFKINDREQNFIVEIKPKKGWFGDRVGVVCVVNEFNEFTHEKSFLIHVSRDSIKFKDNPWRTEGKILVGGLVGFMVVLIGFFIWSRRKRKI